MKLNWGRRRVREEEDRVENVKMSKMQRERRRRRRKSANGGKGCPLVSIIVPVHNAMPWLEETFES